MRLSDEQIDVLLRGIVRSRVKERDGMSYVETWDIRAMMNRVFGFCGWSLISTSPTTLVFERAREVGQAKKPGFTVAYKAELELIVHCADGDARYAGTAIGEATMPDYKLGDAHDMAAKSAESGALKRAATNLGDQFGLSLYRGTLDPVVRRIVGYTPGQGGDDADDHAPPTTTVPAAEPEPQEPSADPDHREPTRSEVADAGAGEDSAPSPAPPPSPAVTAGDDAEAGLSATASASPLDESLGPDPGKGQVRPAGESEEEALARRMLAVEESMKKMNNKDRIKVNALCRGEHIPDWQHPTEDELDTVLNTISKVARGET